MTRSTKQKLADAFTLYHCVKNDLQVKRKTAADGSIATHPIIACMRLPEATVLQQCIDWLTARRIFCDRMNVGKGTLGKDMGFYSYGIIGAGDIIGILPGGRHFEIECKQGKGGRLSEVQQKRMLDVRNAGGMYCVVHGIPELEYYFKGLV